ncbi:c-type cytochrome [Variovorax paradoxus]
MTFLPFHILKIPLPSIAIRRRSAAQRTKHLLLFPLLSLVLCVPATADQGLATAKACMACHDVGKKLVGPSFRDIAGRYKGQVGAADALAGKIMKGSAGAWGSVPMPANAQVNAEEAKRLATWLLGDL